MCKSNGENILWKINQDKWKTAGTVEANKIQASNSGPDGEGYKFFEGGGQIPLQESFFLTYLDYFWMPKFIIIVLNITDEIYGIFGLNLL